MALSTLPQAEKIAYFYRYTRVAPLPFPILSGDPYRPLNPSGSTPMFRQKASPSVKVQQVFPERVQPLSSQGCSSASAVSESQFAI